MKFYTLFDKYVLRTPIFSFTFYKELTKETEISNHKLKDICSNEIIKEALFLASPSFYKELEKWLNDKINSEKDAERIKISLLKYLSRMSSRCTPFGLFAGTSVGHFSKETKLTLDSRNNNQRHTRLDMNYLVSLSQDLAKKEYIKKQILFYPNTSIYKIGNQIRYVEYTYVNGKRNHKIVAVEINEYLERVINLSKKGASYYELCYSLIDDDITLEQAECFIDEILNSQILISDLEPSVSGNEFMEQILQVLKKIEDTGDLVIRLESVKEALKKIDNKIGNPISLYQTIISSLEKLETPFDIKYLFQADLITNPVENQLGYDIKKKIKKGLCFLNRISLKNDNKNLSDFSDKMYKRYETQKVSLSMALDTEIGIGYNQNNSSGDNSSLIDDIILPDRKGNTTAYDRNWTEIHSIFQEKIIDSIENGKQVISLFDKDFEKFNANWNDLPDTFSGMIQFVQIDGSNKIIMKTAGGSSAINLLGRFCFGDEKIHKYVQDIVKIEEEINKEAILAEIVHLPESRVGNILVKPSFRKYEIPYLANSAVSGKNKIDLDDLTINNMNGNIVLESKKINKVIVPRLSNAHNYSYNSLPIYHFLCDLQTQNKREFLGVNLGSFEEDFTFLPRIEYDDIIISLASWYISMDKMFPVLKAIGDNKSLMDLIQNWRSKLKIPQYVLLIEGDNELLINLENITSIKMFLKIIKNKNKFKLTEFILDSGNIMDVSGEAYTNQIIVSFHKSIN